MNPPATETENTGETGRQGSVSRIDFSFPIESSVTEIECPSPPLQRTEPGTCVAPGGGGGEHKVHKQEGGTGSMSGVRTGELPGINVVQNVIPERHR